MLLLVIDAHLLHVGDYFLGELDVMVPHEVDFVLHTVNDASHEHPLLEQVLRVLSDCHGCRIALLAQVWAVEVALEQDDSQEVQHLDLQGVVRVIDRGPERFDDRCDDQVRDFLRQLFVLVYDAEDLFHELAS